MITSSSERMFSTYLIGPRSGIPRVWHIPVYLLVLGAASWCIYSAFAPRLTSATRVLQSCARRTGPGGSLREHIHPFAFTNRSGGRPIVRSGSIHYLFQWHLLDVQADDGSLPLIRNPDRGRPPLLRKARPPSFRLSFFPCNRGYRKQGILQADASDGP